MNRRFITLSEHRCALRSLSILTCILAGALAASAADSTITLTYNVTRYGNLQAVIGRHLTIEKFTPNRYDIAVYEYRLDRSAGTGIPDSMQILHSGLDRAAFSGSAAVRPDPSMLAAKLSSESQLRLTATGDSIEVCGLKAFKYLLGAGVSRELFVWLAPLPAGLENYSVVTETEYVRRTGTFVMSEFLRKTVRAAIAAGVEFPPGSGKVVGDLLPVRIDTATDMSGLLSRDNSYLIELVSVSGISSSKPTQ